MTKELAIRILTGGVLGTSEQTQEAIKMAVRALSQPDIADINIGDTISRQEAIDTEGLDEQIRCEMCRNPMHTDRGCDGNCKYDEKLYERIMQILGERIKPLLSVQPEKRTEEHTEMHACSCISRRMNESAYYDGYDEGYNAGFEAGQRDAMLVSERDLLSAQPKTMSVTLDVQKITKHKSDFSDLPSVRLEYKLDEWCTDCKEYDHERHCCPRFNRVIRETLEEIQAEQKPESSPAERTCVIRFTSGINTHFEN